jgi:hypothetical protein
LPKVGNHQAHALAVFNHTAHKVVKDAFSYARIKANNAYYNDVLGKKMNKKLSSSPAFKAKSKKKRLNCGKDPKHRYGTDGHVCKCAW